VPEPPPAYWEAFRRQVDGRLEARPAPPRRPRPVVSLALAASLLLLVAAAAIVLHERLASPPATAARGAALPAWSALPDPESDPGWAVLQAMAPTGGLLAAVECGLAECLAELSEDESSALAEALRSELRAEGQS
jgi:hypothetical protein